MILGFGVILLIARIVHLTKEDVTFKPLEMLITPGKETKDSSISILFRGAPLLGL